MLVSVITPNYNCSAFVAQAIQSVRSQTFPDWEMIVADDCSTDDSVRIIRDCAKEDGRIRLCQTPAPSGSPLAPRNLALSEARGRFIAFLDSDDLWLPGKLERQMRLFAGGKTAVVFSDYEKISADGVRSGRVVRSPATVGYRELLKSNRIGNLTAVYDAGKTGKLFFQHPGHEDYALWLEILRRGFVAENTGTVEALYRVRADSVSAKKAVAMRWQWDIYRRRMNLSPLSSAYFFCHYLARGFLKRVK
jgi:glycosyltransferase involved in cell wall biosynthesis